MYNTENVSEIFWASNDGFKKGRDPMGIQNSSIALYGQLLPGLTNLTAHIRYYSFYCWLLVEFDKRYYSLGVKQTDVDLYNFIRRAELIMAFLMKGRDVGAVVGSLFVYGVNEDESYDIKKGADLGEGHKYWTYPQGAFGQYYLGSLKYLGLVYDRDKLYYADQKGKELAEAFIKSVSLELRESFLKIIETGVLFRNEVERLEDMCLDKINVESKEWSVLNEILINSDKDSISSSSFRRDTIYLMLKAIQKGLNFREFTAHRFLEYNKCDNETSFGWYYFYLGDVLHYCVETIFWMILITVKNNSYTPIGEFIKLCSESISFSSYKADLGREYVVDSVGDIQNLVKEENSKEAASKALELITFISNKLKVEESVLKNFEKKFDLINQVGYISDIVNRYVASIASDDFNEYATRLVQNIMQDHTSAAYRKMGKNTSDLRKFMIDDGRVFLVEVREPQFTNPRVGSLYYFLVDMSYIDKDGKLADVANQFMSDYERD